jgi:hypothetical protein
MQSVQSYKRRAVSERSRVEKETVRKRSSPVKQPRVDNIKMDLRDVGWDGRDWIDLAQDRDRWRAYVNSVMNLRVP